MHDAACGSKQLLVLPWTQTAKLSEHRPAGRQVADWLSQAVKSIVERRPRGLGREPLGGAEL